MKNFLSSPVWTGIAALVGIVGVIVACLAIDEVRKSIATGTNALADLPQSIWASLTSSTLIPVVLLIALIAFSIPTIWQLLKFVLNTVRHEKEVPDQTHFIPLPIRAGIGNDYLRNLYVDAPAGSVPFCGAEFVFDRESLVFSTNEQIFSSIARDGGIEVDWRLPRPIRGVKAVYVLINSGNSQKIYEGATIGEITLKFQDAPPIIVPLKLGENIREWCPGNPGDFVRETTSPAISKVWDGMGKAGSRAIIDCLTIPIFKSMRSCPLEQISFFHKVVLKGSDTMGVHFFVSGLSLEVDGQTEKKV